jgi:hypothetical protein
MLESMEGTWLGHAMRAYEWAFPAGETLHFFGLCILIGSIGIIDLRLLGFARTLPIRVVHQLLPWVWIGFSINLITGILFWFTQASFYYPNVAFRVKMVLIVLAGLNALWFQFSVHRDLDKLADDADVGSQAKTIASISLGLWIAVIFFGRFIMYWPPI